MNYRTLTPKPRPPLSGTAALSPQALAELCLGSLAEDPEQLARFMTETGYVPDTLRAAIGGEQLSLGLLDYFARNEPLLLSFCANNGVDVAVFMKVWARMNPAG